MKRLIGYRRVSTRSQGNSGLGLDAQQAALDAYARSIGATIIRSYTEVESGKRSDRPELIKALADCRRSKTVLCIAKLDRLARNVHFLSGLMEAGVEFVCCDMPHANKLTIHLMAAMAEWEREQISTRTKDSLRAFREGLRVPKRVRELYPDGVPDDVVEATAGKLGGKLPACRNLTTEAAATGRTKGSQALRQKAGEAYADLSPLMVELRQAGRSLAEIAATLNTEGHTTRRGKPWNKVQVSRVLERISART